MKNLALLVIFSLLISCSTKKIHKEKMDFKFSTAYNQFYIEDKECKGSTGSPYFWTEEAFKERLALENGVIGVATQSYGNIKGEIEVLDKAPLTINYDKYDHVVEAGINLESGEVQILDCPNSHLEAVLNVKPGTYRMRVYSSNLNSVKQPDTPNKTDNDYYRIEIWPSDEMERKVLKQYTNPL